MQTFDVIVVGAGASGLRAAKELKKLGLSVKVLEARNRVGGRTYSTYLESGEYVDLGGQWIGPQQKYVYELLEEYNMKPNPQYDSGKHVLELAKNTYVYEGNISSLAAFAKPKELQQKDEASAVVKKAQSDKPEIDLVWEKLDELCKQINVQSPMDHSSAKEWDNITFEAWTRANVQNESARSFVNWFIGVCLACEPTEVSFLYFLLFLKSGGGYEPMVNIQNGAQQDTVVGGTQMLSVNMQKQLDGNKAGSIVQLNSQVIDIKQSEKGVDVTYKNLLVAAAASKSNSTPNIAELYSTIRGKRVIVALPPPLCHKITYSPPLPALREQLTARMPMGSTIKFNFIYKNAFWRKDGFSGEMVSDIGPMSVMYDKSYKNMNALVGIVAGANAREWSDKTQEERQKAVLDQIYRCFKNEEAYKPIKVFEQDWLKEEFSRGCYMALMTPGLMSQCSKALRQPCGKIHFAGTETADVWIGYIDGALNAGIRAAHEVKNALQQSKL